MDSPDCEEQGKEEGYDVVKESPAVQRRLHEEYQHSLDEAVDPYDYQVANSISMGCWVIISQLALVFVVFIQLVVKDGKQSPVPDHTCEQPNLVAFVLKRRQIEHQLEKPGLGGALLLVCDEQGVPPPQQILM